MDEAAHTFEWKTDKEAEIGAAGKKHEECTVCGYAKAAVEIPALEAPEYPPAEKDTEGGKDAVTPENPQTGDSSNIVLWIAVMLAAGTALTFTAFYNRKKKYSR